MSPVGFNDDFFEERFKPAKPVFDEKTLKELNQGRVFTSKNAELRNLRFSEGLDPQTVHELKQWQWNDLMTHCLCITFPAWTWS